MITDSSLGPILTDAKGMTLYLYDPDAQGESTCYDACEEAWPVLAVEDEDEAVAGEGTEESLIATTERTDGTYQVTYNKWPLYYFARGRRPGRRQRPGQGRRVVGRGLEAGRPSASDATARPRRVSSAQVAGGTLWRPGRASSRVGAGPPPTEETHGQPRQDPQRGPRGPQRERQDHLAEALLTGPAPSRAGPGRGRHEGAATRAGGGQARHLAVARARAVRVDRARRRDVQGQPHRHARDTPTSSARSTRRWRSPTSPCSWSARSRASRSGPRCCGSSARSAGIPRHGVRHQGGQGPRRLPPGARPAARAVRAGFVAAGAAARRGGRRCTGSPTC